MPLMVSQEPDRERARDIAERGTILRSLVGSTVHGLANAGTDDRDEMGVCVEPRAGRSSATWTRSAAA